MNPEQNIPTGFVSTDSNSVNPEGMDLIANLQDTMYALQATLFTDFSGTNYVVIERNGKEYILPVRTD